MCREPTKNRPVRIPFKGSALRAVRLISDLTQAELAREVGVCQSAIFMFEHGRRLPSTEIQRRLAAALKVDPSALFPAETKTDKGE